MEIINRLNCIFDCVTFLFIFIVFTTDALDFSNSSRRLLKAI
ncbi:hypothetical protein A1OE_1189 [Candidatus Endolissoclinum faulkneri L2]|uniref:Uncharacterized protein n=1 Tax=Candidatus Endolissoclinum faulkneri L2 TaxID=1193729 RepID=K7ZDB1_9PROT|nr:hypothetical protein A1OE_1189 [Candidatus Endolissoclinum faulkneri L2]